MLKMTVDIIHIMLECDAEHNEFSTLFYNINILHTSLK